MRFVVIYGSVREQRRGIAAARFTVRQLEQRGHGVTFFDPLELNLPLLSKMYKDYPAGRAPAPLPDMAETIKESDGIVLVTGEYNHGVPPALVNLLDHFLEEWSHRPSAIVSYSAGSFGGVRATEALRCLVAALGMAAIPASLPVPQVQSAFERDGAPKDEVWVARFERFAEELEWYADALAKKRDQDKT